MKHIKIFEQWVSESVNEARYSLEQYKALVKKSLKNPKVIDDQHFYDEMLSAFQKGTPPAKFVAANESANELNENEDAYLLHRLAGNIGQEVAAEFLKDNDLDLNLLSKAIQQKTINKYQLRDILRGDTDKALIKRFIKESVNESNKTIKQ